MSPDDLVRLCEDIVSAVKGAESSNEEIKMWRERFLNEKMPGDHSMIYKDKEEMARIWMCFLYTPSSSLMKTTPEKVLKDYFDSKRSS